jgi:hypothetical protein
VTSVEDGLLSGDDGGWSASERIGEVTKEDSAV